jgi:ADP-ribose pyrophosphatase YjhB (NUDIX family)
MFAEQGKELIATRAIIIVEGKAMLGKRGRGVAVDRFALVGGKPDGDESPAQAIVREVEEETGLRFKDPKLFLEESNDKTVPGQTWHTYYFLGDAEGDLRLKKDEISEVIYVGKDDLKNIDIAFNHSDVLQKYFNRKEQDATLQT